MAATTASGHPESEKLASREMQGSGVYTANTKGCFDVINKAGVRGLPLGLPPPTTPGSGWQLQVTHAPNSPAPGLPLHNTGQSA